MFAKGAKTINLSAISMTDYDKTTNSGKVIMHMSGTIRMSDKKFDTTSMIQDPALYENNFEEAEKDYAEFRKWVKEEWEKIMAESKGE